METLLTKRQAADKLAISPRSLERIVERGEISVTRVGGAIRFSPAELSEFVERASARRERAA